MKIIILLMLCVIHTLFTGCVGGGWYDWYCKKDHKFTFSYPNELSQSEFTFEVDYSEIPESESFVGAEYILFIHNCSDKDELTIELWTKFSSESEYHIDQIYRVFPGKTSTFMGGLYYRNTTGEFADDKERKVSILLKALGSNCFNGEINIKTFYARATLGFITTTCPYGYEVE